MNKMNALLLQIGVCALLGILAFIRFERSDFILFLVGIIGGVALLWLDIHFLYPKYQGKTGEASPSYITRSLLFLLALVGTSIFIVTSSGSALGIGLALGLGTVLGSELFVSLHSPAQLNKTLGLKKPFKKSELQVFVAVFNVTYIVLGLITFWR